MEDQCTCVDCAKMYGYITRVEGDVERVYILTRETRRSRIMELYVGDECEQDHNHAKSKSCTKHYKVEDTSDTYENKAEADEAAAKFECNFCGWVHTPGYWTDAAESAATCCVVSCDTCGVSGWPNFIGDHECRNEEDEYGRPTSMRQTPPWVERGIKVDATAEFTPWAEVWGYDPHEVNIVRASADFYLLEAMTAGLVGTTDGNGNIVLDGVQNHPAYLIIRNDAEAMLNDLVARIAPVLVSYTHMACGGELRHHSAIGSRVLSANRATAWAGWKRVFEAVGNDALVDAATLFEEFGGGSFGGKPWADACRILHAHLTGKINARMFLDRIFNHQHNGGVFLNKVQWEGDLAKNSFSVKEQLLAMPISDMQSVVLPAHGVEPEPDYTTLLAYASPEVQRLFTDAYVYAGHAAHSMGLTLQSRRLKPATGLTRTAKTKAQYAIQKAKQAAENALYQPKYLKSQIKAYTKYVKDYKELASKEAKKNAQIMAELAAGKITGCNCGIADCYYGTGYSEEYQKLHKQYAEQLAEYEKQLPEAEAKAAEVLASGYTPGAVSTNCPNCGSAWHNDCTPEYDEDDPGGPCDECGYYSCECF